MTKTTTMVNCNAFVAVILGGISMASCEDFRLADRPDAGGPGGSSPSTSSAGGGGVGGRSADGGTPGSSGNGGAPGGGGAGGEDCDPSSSAGSGSVGPTPVGACNVPVGQHGLYCGGHGVDGAPDTLYLCDGNVLSVDKVCEFGCQNRDQLLNDRCKDGTARQLLERRLLHPAPVHFLMGLGDKRTSDPTREDAFVFGAPLDIHDVVLFGRSGQGGWPDWRPCGGRFVNLMAGIAEAFNALPMFTFDVLSREVEARGESHLAELLKDDTATLSYWSDVILFLQRVADYGKPTLVQVEPQLWPSAERQSSGNPRDLPIGTLPGACRGWIKPFFPGFGRCWLHLAHILAPNAVVGFQASNVTPDSVSFLNQVGGESTDFVVVAPFARDAGCYESGDCTAPVNGPWYWDEAGVEAHLTWAKHVSEGLSKPILWWQMPLGRPSDTPGRSQGGGYRDDRVQFVFASPGRFAGVSALGGLGAVFGAGDDRQTSVATDAGQFRDAMTAYAAHPAVLP